jgi:hypothetical protein
MKRLAIAVILLLASTTAESISRDDLIDCLRGEPVDVVCPAQ